MLNYSINNNSRSQILKRWDNKCNFHPFKFNDIRRTKTKKANIIQTTIILLVAIKMPFLKNVNINEQQIKVYNTFIEVLEDF